MALQIEISSFVSSGYINPVIWRLYEDTSNVFVDSHQEPGPHGQVYNFVFNQNIRDVVYRIELYDQPGGTGTGLLIKSHVITVTTSVITFDADIETIVDGGQPEDPSSSSTTSPIIASLVGKVYSVQQRGIGQLRSARNVEVVYNTNGSYTLISGQFSPADTYIIKIKPQYVINPPGSVTGSFYKDVIEKTGNYTIDVADVGKMIIVNGTVPVITLTVPATATLMSKMPIFVQNESTVNCQVVIAMQTGETIRATGIAASNTMVISRASGCTLMKVGSTFYGMTDDADIRRRGQLEWGYVQGINRMIADGAEYLTANYPGIKKAMDLMQVGTVVNYSQWASSVVLKGKTVYPYKGFYALSGDGLHFKVPDLRGKFVRAIGSASPDPSRVTQGPGGFMMYDVEPHDHPTADYAGGLVGNTNHIVAPIVAGIAGSKTGPNTGDETTPINIAQIPLIIM